MKYVAENKLLWLLHLLSTYIINSRLYACYTEPSLWWMCGPHLPSLKFHCMLVRWIQYNADCLVLLHSTYTTAFTILSSSMNYNYVQLVRQLNCPLYRPSPVIHDYYYVYISCKTNLLITNGILIATEFVTRQFLCQRKAFFPTFILAPSPAL